MSKAKKTICLLAAVIIVIVGALVIVPSITGEKEPAVPVITDEETSSFMLKFGVEENFNYRYDEVIDKFFLNDLGEVGFEYIGFSDYEFSGVDKNETGFEVFFTVGPYGVTGIYIVPTENNKMLHKVYKCNLEGVCELIWQE